MLDFVIFGLFLVLGVIGLILTVINTLGIKT